MMEPVFRQSGKVVGRGQHDPAATIGAAIRRRKTAIPVLTDGFRVAI
jgi:hypothetical protein